MAFDLIGRVETMGRPKVVGIGDLILDRCIWGDAKTIGKEAPVSLLHDSARTSTHNAQGTIHRSSSSGHLFFA